MSDTDWLTCGPMRPLVRQLQEKAVKRYRIDPEVAEELILEVLSGQSKLRELAEHDEPPKNIARTRVFKDSSTEALRRIYYALREYKLSDHLTGTGAVGRERLYENRLPETLPDDLKRIALGHVSMRERLHVLSSFYEKLFALVGTVHSVLDVGCGVQPLTFPFDDLGKSVRFYVAADKDAESTAALEKYAQCRGDGRLIPVCRRIEEGWTHVPLPPGAELFDLALLLKLIPVINRQQRGILSHLENTPANRMLITGSTISMTKRRSIERRERSVMLRFIDGAGLQPLEEFRVGEEFGWLVERSKRKGRTDGTTDPESWAMVRKD